MTGFSTPCTNCENVKRLMLENKIKANWYEQFCKIFSKKFPNFSVPSKINKCARVIGKDFGNVLVVPEVEVKKEDRNIGEDRQKVVSNSKEQNEDEIVVSNYISLLVEFMNTSDNLCVSKI